MANNAHTSRPPDLDLILVVVGTSPDHHTFRIPKDLLINASSFFRSHLTSSQFPEGRESRVDFPEDDTKAFEIIHTILLESENLEDWTWPHYLPQDKLHDPLLVSAYLLANRLCMEDVCNQLMQNIHKAFEYCHGYCTDQYDIKHGLAGALACPRTYDLPESELKEWAMRQNVEAIAYTGIWLFCDCKSDCECFSRCECKPKCTCVSQKGKGDECDSCLGKVRWHCRCRSEKVVKEGCCLWCRFTESDEEQAVELKEAIEQEKQRQKMPSWERPNRDDCCEFHVHVDTEKCLEHHRLAHLVGKSKEDGEETE